MRARFRFEAFGKRGRRPIAPARSAGKSPERSKRRGASPSGFWVRRARTYSLARLCQSTRMISPDHKTASPQSRHLPRARSERPDRRAAEQRDERWRSFDTSLASAGILASTHNRDGSRASR
jgi:hypothetical protein